MGRDDFPSWKVVGLECAGWGGTNPEEMRNVLCHFGVEQKAKHAD
jgi:hypothetical protein